MPAAIAIPAIIGAASTGAQLVGAKMQSNAAHRAADIQSRSTDRAQAFNQQVYNDQRADMRPYVQGGTSAFQTLLSGWQNKQGGARPGLPTPFSGQAPSPFGPSQGAPGGSPMSGGLAGAMPQGAPQGQPQAPQGGGMVALRAPDGSVQSVPAQFADQFIAKGAQRVQ